MTGVYVFFSDDRGRIKISPKFTSFTKEFVFLGKTIDKYIIPVLSAIVLLCYGGLLIAHFFFGLQL